VRYDVWKEHDGLAKRSLFVVDRDGVIRHRWVTEDALVTPDEREAIELMASL
jgi:peroxiredoxin